MDVTGGTSDDVRRRRVQRDLARRRQNAAVNLLPGLGQPPFEAEPTVDDLQRYFVARLAQRQRYQVLDGYDALLESEYPDLIPDAAGSTMARPAARPRRARGHLHLVLVAVLSLAVRLCNVRPAGDGLPLAGDWHNRPEEFSFLRKALSLLTGARGAGQDAYGGGGIMRDDDTRLSRVWCQARYVGRSVACSVPPQAYSDSTSRTDTALAVEGRISALVE